MSKLYTRVEATIIANISKKLMHELIEKQIIIPEHIDGQLFFSESETNKLKALVEENKLKPDTSKIDKMLRQFSSSSDVFPRDGELLEETYDILFQLQVLKNLSTKTHLVLYKNMINPSKFLYVIEENQVTYTPIGLDKITVDKIYLIKSKYAKIEVQDICRKGTVCKQMRNFLAEYFYGNNTAMKEQSLSKLNKNNTERQYEKERETVYIINQLDNTYIDHLYIKNKLSLPLLKLNDHVFSEALNHAIDSIDLELLKIKMRKKNYNAVCPIHGPVWVVIGGIISPTWTWAQLFGRHWEFSLCPHCFFTFSQRLIAMS